MDAAWPLSMLWILVVGITVVIAGWTAGWRRFVPLLCGLWFPLGGVAMVAFGDESGVVGFGLAAVFWFLLGHVARSSDDEARGPALTPGPVAW